MTMMGIGAADAGMGVGGTGITGASGFDFGSLMSNPMVLQMMATMGANLDPQGAGGALGNMALGNIKSKSYLEMMKKMLGGGAKFTFDNKGFNIKGDNNALSALDQEGKTSSIQDPASFYGVPSGQVKNSYGTI